MEFRWVAIIALWTLLIGPVLGPPVTRSAKTHAVHQPAASAPALAPERER
jgi:hypothetical protein